VRASKLIVSLFALTAAAETRVDPVQIRAVQERIAKARWQNLCDTFAWPTAGVFTTFHGADNREYARTLEVPASESDSLKRYLHPSQISGEPPYAPYVRVCRSDQAKAVASR
jgi:hypothetical protein